MEMHDIENYFTSPMKIFKSGTFYIVRTNIPSGLGKTTLKIYDEFEKEVSMESINEHTDLMTIIEVQGIKCSAKSFQIELEIKQMMVFKSVNLFERCIIKTGGETKRSQDPYIEDIVINEAPVSATRLEEEEEEHEELAEDDLVENNDSLVNAEPDHLEEEPVQPPPPPQKNPEEIEEIDFNLEQLSLDDTIQIKRRNDVYYEMYREARKKAKIAKDLALSSYLEAKRIKNTYMLNDVVDSDSSDLEELDAEEADED
jgi:hypothetical protein